MGMTLSVPGGATRMSTFLAAKRRTMLCDTNSGRVGEGEGFDNFKFRHILLKPFPHEDKNPHGLSFKFQLQIPAEF